MNAAPSDELHRGMTARSRTPRNYNRATDFMRGGWDSVSRLTVMSWWAAEYVDLGGEPFPFRRSHHCKLRWTSGQHHCPAVSGEPARSDEECQRRNLLL